MMAMRRLRFVSSPSMRRSKPRPGLARIAVCGVIVTPLVVMDSSLARAGEPEIRLLTVEDSPRETHAEKADRLSMEGSAAFQAGDLETALTRFSEAYELDPTPDLVFNMGRVHEQLGNLEAAAEAYAKFVRLPGIDLETRRFALEKLDLVRHVLDRSKALTPHDPAQPTAVEPEVVTPPQVAPSPVLVETEDKQPSLRRRLRIAGGVTTGIGAAAFITAGVLGGISAQRVAAADQEVLIPDANDLRRSARPYSVAADSLFLAGGVLAIAGVTMIGVSFSKRLGQRQAFVPTLIPRRHAGFGYILRF